jgi:hypothetical protein
MVSGSSVSTCLVLLSAVAFAPCGVANSLRGRAFLRNRVKLVQAHQASSQLEKNQHVLEQALRTLAKDMPSDVDDTADKSIVGLETADETKQPLVGLIPAPTEEDLQFLRNQVSSAHSYVEKLAEESQLSPSDAPPECVMCRKLSKQGSKQILEEKESALKNIKSFVDEETKRQKMLPKLLQTMLKEAVKAHKKRVAAENKTNEALAKQSMLQFQNASTADISNALIEKKIHEIDRLRLEDRIRARERLRVAACAMFQADAEYRKHHKNSTKVDTKVAKEVFDVDAEVKEVKAAENTNKTSLLFLCAK